jgi:hypothetical protein
MNILDPRFKYTPAARTDLRATFARIRREQQAAARAAEQATPEATAARIAQAEAAVAAAARVRLPGARIKRVA